MNWKLLLATASRNMFTWRLITTEAIGFSVVWGAYFIGNALVQDPFIKTSLPDWVVMFLSVLLWPTVIFSGIIFVTASVKSPLPAAIAWIMVLPFFILDFDSHAVFTLLFANIAVVLYAIGFLTGGPRVRASERVVKHGAN